MVAPLDEARVSLVAYSTYDTDYVLVPAVRLAEATAALVRARHRVLD
ncbi:ACT domain-containing protein [Micromonospora craniellae]